MNRTNPTTHLSADEALQALPDQLRAQLAALAGAPPEAAEAAVSLLPYGHRALLEGYGLTRTTTPTAEGEEAVNDVEEPRQRVTLTPLAWAVIEACAHRGEKIPEDSELDRRIEVVREQLVHEMQATQPTVGV